MSAGWCRMWRAIDECPAVAGNSDRQAVFLALVRWAKWEDCEVWSERAKSVVALKRGQCVVSMNDFGFKNLTRQNIRTILNSLKSNHMIDLQTNQHGTVVTVCKYDEYQGDDLETNQRINQPINQRPTNGQPTANQPIDKEGEEDKEIKEDSPPVSPSKRGKAKRKTSWPKDFTLTDEMAAYADKHTPGVDAEADFEKFRLWAEAKGQTYVNWKSAWQNWCRSDFGKPMKRNGANGHGAKHSNPADELFKRAAQRTAEARSHQAPGNGRDPAKAGTNGRRSHQAVPQALGGDQENGSQHEICGRADRGMDGPPEWEDVPVFDEDGAPLPDTRASVVPDDQRL